MELIEGTDLVAESSSVRRRRIRAKSSLTLGLIGWLIIGSALNAIIFGSFPLKLGTVEWQLNLIGALLSSGFSFLVGATLIVVAQLLNPKDSTLQSWQLSMSRLSAWFAILLILIIPVQYFLGSRALKNIEISAAKAIEALNTFSNKIAASNSELEMRAYVASLPNPPPLPARFDADFPVIKQRAVENIKYQINAVKTNAQSRKSEAFQLFMKEAIRNSSQAILMAAAFSTLANLSSKSENLVTRLFYELL